MRTLRIQSNAASVATISISDMGLVLGPAGASVDLASQEDLSSAVNSSSLRALATDGAFAPSGSTLLIFDLPGGVSPGTQIAESGVDDFLATVHLQSHGPYSFLQRNASGSLPPTVALEAETHKTLRQLIHLAESGGPFEGFGSPVKIVTYSGALPTLAVWYKDGTLTGRIIDRQYIYPTGSALQSQDIWRVYDAADTNGTLVVATATDTITRTGALVTRRDRVITT